MRRPQCCSCGLNAAVRVVPYARLFQIRVQFVAEIGMRAVLDSQRGPLEGRPATVGNAICNRYNFVRRHMTTVESNRASLGVFLAVRRIYGMAISPCSADVQRRNPGAAGGYESTVSAMRYSI